MARLRSPSPQQLVVLRRLGQDPELTVFLEVLKDERAATDRALRMAEAIHELYRLQGRAALLEELIDAVENAPQRVERAR